jgi:hypothetical protein
MAKVIYILADGMMRWWRLPRYASRAERQFRMQRGFPTVDHRVRLYMAHWYLPPCPGTVRLSYSVVPVPHRLKNITTWWSDSTLRSVTDDIDYVVTAPGVPVLPAAAAVVGGGHPPQPPQNLTISSRARPDEVFYLDNDELYYCYRQRDWSIRFYCRDAQLSMGGGRANNFSPPIFLEFTDHSNTVVVMHRDDNDDGSDGGGGTTTGRVHNNNNKIDNPNIPVIKKLRLVLPKSELEDILNDTYNHSSRCQDLAVLLPSQPYRQPILWLLNTNRHFKYSWDIPRYDIPWHDKKDSAIFRGELTGLQYDPTVTAEENCDRLPRCRLVVQNAGHLRVDALLTNTFGKIPDVLQGVNVTGPKLRRADFLQHKGLIVLEGNDVSSGLKWSMVSNSVVLMPPPTFTSWAMEELLEPWQHYIPLRPDLSDVDQKVQWMLANQAESQRIAHRAKLWILDLYFHPDAMKEAKLINEEILRRYRLLFEENDGAGP